MWDTASLTVDQLAGSLLDVTLANSASFTATANPELTRSTTNFVVDETIADPISGWSFESFAVSKQLTSMTGRLNATVAISGTRTTFGLVLHSGADVVLNQSEVLLIPVFFFCSCVKTKSGFYFSKKEKETCFYLSDIHVHICMCAHTSIYLYMELCVSMYLHMCADTCRERNRHRQRRRAREKKEEERTSIY